MKVALSFGFCLLSIFSFGQYNDGAESLPDVWEHNVEVLAISTTTYNRQSRIGIQVQHNMLFSEGQRVFVSIGGHYAPHYVGSYSPPTLTSQSINWSDLTVAGIGFQVGVGAKYTLSDFVFLRWSGGVRAGVWHYSGQYSFSDPFSSSERHLSTWGDTPYILPELSVDLLFKFKKDSSWGLILGGTSAYGATYITSRLPRSTSHVFLPNAYIGASYKL